VLSIFTDSIADGDSIRSEKLAQFLAAGGQCRYFLPLAERALDDNDSKTSACEYDLDGLIVRATYVSSSAGGRAFEPREFSNNRRSLLRAHQVDKYSRRTRVKGIGQCSLNHHGSNRNRPDRGRLTRISYLIPTESRQICTITFSHSRDCGMVSRRRRASRIGEQICGENAVNFYLGLRARVGAAAQ
jgi:hypothetical protein